MNEQVNQFQTVKFEYHDKPRVLFVTETTDTTFGGYVIEEADQHFFKHVFDQMISEAATEQDKEEAKDIFENSIKPLYQFKKFSINKVTKWL